jgi:twitching motility protein PilU
VQDIKEVMEKSESIGMRTFDAALFHLYKDGKISLDEALKNADSPNNLRLRIDLGDSDDAAPAAQADDPFAGLSLLEEEEPEEQENADGRAVFKLPDEGGGKTAN